MPSSTCAMQAGDLDILSGPCAGMHPICAPGTVPMPCGICAGLNVDVQTVPVPTPPGNCKYVITIY